MTGPHRTPELRFDTAVTRLLEISHPVLNAPMGDTAGGRLAAAVSDGGGLGMIGGGYGDPSWLERELDAAAGSRVGVGFISFALDTDDGALFAALEAAPAAIQLSFGDPRPHAEAVHAAGVPLLCGVQSTADVDLAMEAGAHVLVAQGSDAGGHGRAGPSTLAVIPAVRALEPDVPLVAAGGIGDGRAMAAALALGADGVSMGTRFLATYEAIASVPERQAVLGADAAATVRTEVFDLVRGPRWPDGHDGRVVRNGFVDDWHAGADLEALAERFERSDPADTEVRPVWAGESAGMVDDVVPAADLVRRVIAEATGALARLERLTDCCGGDGGGAGATT